jgi:hypothetical protein
MQAIRIILLLVLAPAVAAGPLRAATPVDLELVLAVDVSGSIDDQEARLQRDGYVKALLDPTIIRAITSGMLGRIAVTYFEWAGDEWQEPVIGWGLIDGVASARKYAARLADADLNAGPWTSISSAIDHAVTLFAANGFQGTRRVIDISGDGPNNTGWPVKMARDEAVARRVTINGLPIMNDRFNISRPPMASLDLYYRNCVIGGPGAFLVVARNFKDFARAIRRKLILEIAGISPAPGRDRAADWANRGLLHRVAAGARAAPPCDIGERRFRRMMRDRW